MGIYNSFYAGIVVNDKDPEELGRVQVYITKIGPTLKSARDGSLINFRTIGEKYGSLTEADLKALKKQLPWCYTVSQIFSGSSIGRYNEETGKATTSKTATSTDEFQFKGKNYGASAPGKKYNVYGAYSDAFADPTNHYLRHGNHFGRDYFSKSYINAPNGIFANPAVNAKVLVVYLGGSKINGVIIGKLPWAIEQQLMKDS